MLLIYIKQFVTRYDHDGPSSISSELNNDMYFILLLHSLCQNMQSINLCCAIFYDNRANWWWLILCDYCSHVRRKSTLRLVYRSLVYNYATIMSRIPFMHSNWTKNLIFIRRTCDWSDLMWCIHFSLDSF